MIYSCPLRRAFVSGRCWFKGTLSVLVVIAGAAGLSVSAQGLSGVAAANVTVVENDTNNTPVSMTLSTSLAVNNFKIFNSSSGSTTNGRGNYYVQIGTAAGSDVTNGILVESIDNNGLSYGESSGTNFGACGSFSFTTAKPGTSGQWRVATFGSNLGTNSTTPVATTNYPACNFNFAAAYFQYAKGWYGGWLVNSNGNNNSVTNLGGTNGYATLRWFGNTNMVLGTNVTVPGPSGQVQVNLLQFGLDSRSNAVLICCGGKNEENYADSQANTDGTWTVTCRDDIAGSGEADPSAFVCIPVTNHTVISGRFNGSGPTTTFSAVLATTNCPITMQSTTFFVTNTSKGTYHLVIPGYTPSQGVLIISGEESSAGAIYTDINAWNSDNTVSYQANGNGWDIQTRDSGTGPNLQNLPSTEAVASFVFIPAPLTANPIAVSRNVGSPLLLSVTNLITTYTLDSTGSPVSPSALGIPTNGTVSISSDTNWVLYTPSNLDATTGDSFTYTVADTNGNTATARVVVTVAANTSTGSPGTINMSNYPVSVAVAMRGIPNYYYDIQRATDALFTQNVTTLVTAQRADINGLLNYTDTTPPSPNAFYRLKYNHQ